jgi:hypothetical protein
VNQFTKTIVSPHHIFHINRKIPKCFANTSLQADLEKWGYISAPADKYFDFDKSLPIKTALASLGLDTASLPENGLNRATQLEHENAVTLDNVTYQPTHALFSTIFNPTDGVIIAWGSYGAKYKASILDPPISLLPDLQHWSDITFLQWTRIAVPNTHNLRYIFRAPIENTEF